MDKDTTKTSYYKWIDKNEAFLLSQDEVNTFLIEKMYGKDMKKQLMLKASFEERFFKHSKVMFMYILTAL